MRLLSLVFALTFLAGPLFGAGVLPATTYTDSLAGEITNPGSGSVSLVADASGELPGSFTMSLNFSGAAISNGDWRLVVKRRNSDESVTELGVLTGVVSSGTVNLNPDGSMASLNSVQLQITSGSGNYGAVTSGGGTLAGAVNGQSSPPFSGPLSLNF
jgi:hypothetical protein